MYRIKNSKHLASVINYTNLSNMISEAEMTEFLNQAKELLKEEVKVMESKLLELEEKGINEKQFNIIKEVLKTCKEPETVGINIPTNAIYKLLAELKEDIHDEKQTII